MKTITTLAICGLAVGLLAEEINNPYIIQRGEETIVVNDMPAPRISDPISNSFVYIDGEYIEPPYVVSISNLSVRVNGRIVRDAEPYVKTREWYLAQPFKRVGITPESVGDSVNGTYEFYERRLKMGTVSHVVNGAMRIGYASYDGDGGALALVEKARKAIQGDEKTKHQLINEMGLENHQAKLRPDWIERLANNTNLEVRATSILDAKREREQQEREKREQQNRQDEKTQ